MVWLALRRIILLIRASIYVCAHYSQHYSNNFSLLPWNFTWIWSNTWQTYIPWTSFSSIVLLHFLHALFNFLATANDLILFQQTEATSNISHSHSCLITTTSLSAWQRSQPRYRPTRFPTRYDLRSRNCYSAEHLNELHIRCYWRW